MIGFENCYYLYSYKGNKCDGQLPKNPQKIAFIIDRNAKATLRTWPS
jgi:hypothetical protein